jgi:exonuclease III
MKTKTVTQQYSMMVEKGLPFDRHSRQQFCLDLSKYIADLKNNGQLILLLGDFNRMLGANPDDMETVAQAGRLQDVMATKLAEPTSAPTSEDPLASILFWLHQK